jgi:hypothetical protein
MKIGAALAGLLVIAVPVIVSSAADAPARAAEPQVV